VVGTQIVDSPGSGRSRMSVRPSLLRSAPSGRPGAGVSSPSARPSPSLSTPSTGQRARSVLQIPPLTDPINTTFGSLGSIAMLWIAPETGPSGIPSTRPSRIAVGPCSIQSGAAAREKPCGRATGSAESSSRGSSASSVNAGRRPRLGRVDRGRARRRNQRGVFKVPPEQSETPPRGGGWRP